ncbi:MAG: hypothetical protein ABIA04_05870 [Pseudomonadota bacterium]
MFKKINFNKNSYLALADWDKCHSQYTKEHSQSGDSHKDSHSKAKSCPHSQNASQAKTYNPYKMALEELV